MTADTRPCLCACGRQIARTRSLPLCKEAAVRLRTIFRERARGLGPDAYQREFNRVHSSPATVAGLLTVAVGV